MTIFRIIMTLWNILRYAIKSMTGECRSRCKA